MKTRPETIGRRTFLSGVAGATAGAVIHGTAVGQVTATDSDKPLPSTTPQFTAGQAPPSAGPAVTEFIHRPNSDVMVDIIKGLGLEFVATLPGSSFRGLHESIINYGGNKAPELLTCLHEEASVAIADGYARVTGKPMAVMAHGTVGLQHAMMAIYVAWCDRVPVVLIAGNTLDAAIRRQAEWAHSMLDPGSMLRDCTKWDDQPQSLQHFAESMTRAYRIAVTPPTGPVLITVDSELQEHPADESGLNIPALSLLTAPQGDPAAVAEAAKWLVAAANPVIVADSAVRTARGFELLVGLAETLGAPVVDRFGRLNFPTDHPLNLTDQASTLISQADVILGLEVMDFWGIVHKLRDLPVRDYRRIVGHGTKLISVGMNNLHTKANYQEFQRYSAVDLAIACDAEATLPALIEAIRHESPAGRSPRVADRIEHWRKAHADMRAAARAEAAVGWNAIPITLGRLHAEIWHQIRNEDWALYAESNFQGYWAQRLWPFKKHHQFTGCTTGAGSGHNAPAAVGAALAHREHGRLVVNIQTDGDLLCLPGTLWTAAHHRIPLLTVMHNNRAYHQETMHIQRMANRRERGIDRAHIGTAIDDPPVDFAKVAQGMGVWAAGPINDPNDLAPALKRAIAVVKRGEPALIDIVTQPR